MWPCQAELLLHLPAEDVVPWLTDGEVQQVSETSSRVRVGSWSWAGLLSWILRFDAPFTILGPPEFLAAVPGFAARVADSTPRAAERRRDDERGPHRRS